MYAGLRHGLVLSSRTAEACYSRRRRLPVSLVRCRSYEAVERRLDGEAEHGLDDEKQPPLGGHTPTARDEHYQLPQERDERTPRKAYQNGRSYNGANADGGAAPATPLPWDVLGRAQFTESRSRSMKLPWHSSREDDHSFVSSTGAFTEKTNGSGAVPPPLLPSFPFDSPARIPVAPWMASATRNNNSKGQNASKPRVAWLEQDDDGALDFGGNEGAAAACGRHGLTNSVNGSEQDEVNPFGLPIRRQANNGSASNAFNTERFGRPAPRDSVVSSVSESQSLVNDNAMSHQLPSRLPPADPSAVGDTFGEAEFARIMSQPLPIRLPTRPSPTPTPSSSGNFFSNADLARAMSEPLPSRPPPRPAFTRQDEKIDEDELTRALNEPLPSRLPLRAPPNLPGRRMDKQEVPQQRPLPPPPSSWIDTLNKRAIDQRQTAQVPQALPQMPSRPTQTLGVLESPKATLLESMMEKAKEGSRLSIFGTDGRRPGGLLGPSERRANLPWAKLKELEVTSTRDAPNREKNWHLTRAERYTALSVRERDEQRRIKELSQEVQEVQTPPVPVTVRELGMALAKKAHLVMRALRKLGENRVYPTTIVDPDTAELVAIELGLTATRAPHRQWDVKRTVVTVDMGENLTPRAPVVSVMGHVDHGKTTLLDALRTSKVAGTESAGITQKIGAFSVNVKDSAVTFFDTPGHAAFKSMRHSTSRLTDIVIVVVAADDGVKTQTIEVLGLLKQFPNLAPVVAVTKIDKPGVDTEEAVDRISRQLLQHDIMTEGYGGEVPIVPVSAMTQEGFDDLLETLLLQAEIMELRADEKAPAEGVVVDSSIVKGRGLVTDMLVSWGKLKVGDIVLAGMEFGKVKSMMGSDGKAMKEAGTAQPVRVIGFKGLPKMGDEVVVVESEEKARTIIGERERERQQAQLSDQSDFIAAKRAKEELASRLKVEAQNAVRAREKAIFDARIALRLANDKPDDLKAQAAAEACKDIAAKSILEANAAEERAKRPYEEEDVGGPKACNAVFKAEGFGMLEAMTQVLDGIPQDEVKLNVIRTGVGPVTQSDVDAAIVADAPIFAFNVGVERPDVKAMAHRGGVQIHTNKVIYRFLDDVKAAMSNFLSPDMKEQIVGEGEILEVFDTKGKAGDLVRVAGTSVSMGKLVRTHMFRVVRNGDVLKQEMKVSSMRRFKDRVNEVTRGKECGLALEGFTDLEKGDVIQCYYTEAVKRHF